jgi:hypothetical protein
LDPDLNLPGGGAGQSAGGISEMSEEAASAREKNNRKLDQLGLPR